MTRILVQYRLLQAYVSHVGDERVTLGLVHWDGRMLRTAANALRVGDTPALRAHASFVRRLTDVQDQAKLGNSLNEVFAPPFLESGMLRWGEVCEAICSVPAVHFEHLVSDLRLRPPASSNRAAFAELVETTASEIAGRLPGRTVATGVEITALRAHISPFSWKNEVWNHSFPIDLRWASSTELPRRFEQVLGRIESTLPTGSRAAVLAVHQEGSKVLVDELARIRLLQEERSAGRVRTFPMKSLGETVETAAFESLVLSESHVA